MNLWIRSQDKERLVKVDKIELYENKDNTDDEYKKCAIYEYTDSERQYLLGIYKTKERALEVLDEIQNKINYIDAISNFDLSNIDAVKAILPVLKENNIDNLSCIYVMPKE